MIRKTIHMQLYTFQTNIKNTKTGELFLNLLPHYFKINKISFAVKGVHGVLQIKAKNLSPNKIQSTLKDIWIQDKNIRDVIFQ